MQSLQADPDRETALRIQSDWPSLKAVDVRKSFSSPAGERLEVLRGVSLEVGAGEVVAITGASGAGKSTLLHLLGGLEEPDHGSIRLAKSDFGSLKAEALADLRQRSISFVFQFHYLLSDLTAAENVGLPLWIARVNRDAVKTRVRDLLTQMGLADRADHQATHLSGGEQQRIALARALITLPLLLLADEPTGNLDAEIGDEIGETLVNYVRQHNAMAIIATHNERLASACDRVLILEGGRLHSI